MLSRSLRVRSFAQDETPHLRDRVRPLRHVVEAGSTTSTSAGMPPKRSSSAGDGLKRSQMLAPGWPRAFTLMMSCSPSQYRPMPAVSSPGTTGRSSPLISRTSSYTMSAGMLAPSAERTTRSSPKRSLSAS